MKDLKIKSKHISQDFSVIFLTAIMMIMISGCKPKLVPAKKEVAPRISVIPNPAFVEEGEGMFEITPDFRILTDVEDKEIRAIGGHFAEKLRKASGLDVPVVEISGEIKLDEIAAGGITTGEIEFENTMTMRLKGEDKNLGSEGYELEINPSSITLEARQQAGLFYGIQTLLQLLPPEIESVQGLGVTTRNRLTLPALKIRDIPRYPYRGMHLDCCRHFFPKAFVKRYIDLLALHKFNTFHWHLTEDQGWRIEIKKYPRLTEVGGWRSETLVGHARELPEKFDGQRYGGFYTQEDIKEIVEYAQSRYVTIIPEIEMPGHATAALAAYPELSCTGGPFEVATKWGVFEDVYCAGEEKVFEFLEDVLSEVIVLFPGTYIHIGGDECPKVRWKECDKCQARIAEEGLADEHELQSYFIRRIEKLLISKEKKLIGWDEILEGGLAPEATVMSWRGTQGGIEAARQGHDVIMTPTSHCYFDYYQADPETEPLAIGGFTPLEKVYSFEPAPEELTEEEARYVLGAQGNLWTEYIKTPEQAEYMSVPRMCALAEVVWSRKEARDWEDFLKRLTRHFRRLDGMEVNYCRSSYRAEIGTRLDEEQWRNEIAK